MNIQNNHRPLLPLITLSLALIFIGLGGIYGGYAMITDPSGSSMGMSVTDLERTLFDDYFIPGLLVLLIWGVGSFVLLAFLWLRPNLPALSWLFGWTHQHWIWGLIVTFGSALLIWLTYQLLTLQSIAVIQLILYVLAVLLIAIPMFPSMRRYYHTAA